MREILTKLIEHRTLDHETARNVLLSLATGKFNGSQVSAFLTVFMMRAITLEELKGFRDAMMELCIPVRFDRPVIDLCGTGGDGKNTFNVSTLASFIVAGTGQGVAKHGNYGVSSVSGSSNVLEYFGYKFSSDEGETHRAMDSANIAFLHAPMFHPAMKNVGSIRRELGIKTFFNMLGPMVNPASPSFQLVGVFNLELARMYGYLYQGSGKSFAVIHDLNGFDEVSLTAPFKMYSNEGEEVVDPEVFGFGVQKEDAIRGGTTIEESARLFVSILEGKGTTGQNAIVIANAALALQCVDRSVSLESCIAGATESLQSGKALLSFKKLMQQ